MKNKKFNSKLALNKETVAKLDKNEMNEIRGGGSNNICLTSRGGWICISLTSCGGSCKPPTQE